MTGIANFITGDLYILALSSCEFSENQCSDCCNCHRAYVKFCMYFQNFSSFDLVIFSFVKIGTVKAVLYLRV